MADDPQASMQWQIASYIFHHIYQCHPLALVLLRCAPLSIHLIGIDFHPPEWILYFIYALITFTIFHVITSHSFPLSKNFKFHSTCQIDAKKSINVHFYHPWNSIRDEIFLFVWKVKLETSGFLSDLIAMSTNEESRQQECDIECDRVRSDFESYFASQRVNLNLVVPSSIVTNLW